ncbi:MAG: hypothetical protein H6943_09315 [Zoogloeaceae bacterium]|nr:hypothetical protein [Zoogloeaceae bacterium]
MADHHDDIVDESTRRIVGREALRRASRLVQQWRYEEHDKRQLAHTIIKILVIAAPLLFVLTYFYYR